MAGKISRAYARARLRIGKIYTLTTKKIRQRPFVSFYLALLLFVMIILLSSFLQTPAKVKEIKSPPKEVALYYIGSVPKIKVSAQIEKSGVVKIVALAGGVVQQINYREGDKVDKGNTIIGLSTNYQGGNAASAQRQLAQNQYQSVLDTFGLQKNIIQGQRDIATKSAENSEKMREIQNSSRETTRNLIDLNKTILESLDNRLNELNNGATPNSAAGESVIGIQGQKAQLLAGLAQAQSSLAGADYQANSDRPPAQLAALQKDLTLKQLDLQEKMLSVNKEASRLQLQLSQITEALMYPSAPVSGTVQRVFVNIGDVVNPGQELAIIAQAAEDDPIIAVAYVPAEISGKISRLEESVLNFNGTTIKEFPYFVSQEAVSGNSYAVYYSVPDSYSRDLTDNGYIDIEIPIGYAPTTAAAAYVPVDAIYQTDTASYLFVNQKGTSKSRNVELGGIYGEYVAVNKGLKDGDQVILTRNVVDGDKVQIAK